MKCFQRYCCDYKRFWNGLIAHLNTSQIIKMIPLHVKIKTKSIIFSGSVLHKHCCELEIVWYRCWCWSVYSLDGIQNINVVYFIAVQKIKVTLGFPKLANVQIISFTGYICHKLKCLCLFDYCLCKSLISSYQVFFINNDNNFCFNDSFKVRSKNQINDIRLVVTGANNRTALLLLSFLLLLLLLLFELTSK